MAYRCIALIFLITLSVSTRAQSSQDIMIGGAFDFIKTDNTRLLDKAQIGFEANYFVTRKFTATAGVEIWTFRDESFVFGSRWYFLDDFYMRFRGLIGENDFSIGAGGAIHLKPNLRLELIGDYYFEREFAFRTGLAYIIRLR